MRLTCVFFFLLEKTNFCVLVVKTIDALDQGLTRYGVNLNRPETTAIAGITEE